jgi:cyclophilin family peptidyl-prolyl cis-trans isomerase
MNERIVARALLLAALAFAAVASIGSAQPPPPPAPPAKPPAPSPAPSPSPSAAGQEVVLETAEGAIVIRLLPDRAPKHVAHFVKTAKSGGYDGTVFHRIIPGGIIQGGDPLSKDPAQSARYGQGGLGLLKAEFSDRPFTRGVVAAARRPSGTDTGGSQFFICLGDQPSLLGQYTIFGEVVEGMDVADRLGQTPVDEDKPKSRVEIKKATVRAAVSAAPGESQPK